MAAAEIKDAEAKCLAYTAEVVGHNKETTEDELDRAGGFIFADEWGGVWAKGEKPLVSRAKPYGIMNLGGRNGGGTHWLAVVWGPKKLHVWDSFGRALGTLRLGPKFVELGENQIKVQRNAEQNCGQRALAALFVAAADKRLEHVPL